MITVANANAFEPKYTFGAWRAFVCRHWKIYLNIFSKSLTIHQVKIAKITTVNEVWIPGLLTILLLRLLLSFCFDWEDISYTRSRQPANASSKHLEFRPKMLRCGSSFQRSSRCLDIPMKHSHSCLTFASTLGPNEIKTITYNDHVYCNKSTLWHAPSQLKVTLKFTLHAVQAKLK